ncbi:MAG TPA: ABC transporter family substrate-binding protein [Pseudonocardiaceae bacterium]|jgi:peptide/nickel transport system substrate-binding protein|nr:ABC transporter family substrate-binding protein [Pseudonocardiaceae bacterium]
MRRSGVLRVAALVAGATVLLSACAGGNGGGDGVYTGTVFADCAAQPNTCNSADADALAQGGDLSFAIEKNIANWNVLSSEGNVLETGFVLKGVLPATFLTQPDLTVALNKNLLESATMTSTNPQTIVYKIKSNAAWSDSTPITADDFSYNWRVQNGRDCPACAPATTSGFDQVQSVVGSDQGRTVTVTFTKPFTDWKQLWAGGAPIYPAHVAAKHGDIRTPQGLADSFTWFGKNVPTYSGGPFQVASFQDNVSVTLVPNPEWYGPIPHLGRVIFRIITDAAQEPQALRNDEVQVIYPQPQLDLVQQVRDMAGVSSSVGLGLNWEHIDLNLANPFLADKALRTALFTAVDRQAIIDKTVGQFNNKVPPMNNHNFVPQQRGYADVLTETGQGSGDLERAKKILTDAGYRIQGGRLITPAGKPVPAMRIRYTTGNQIRQTECELFAAQVKPLGVPVQVVPTDDLGGTLDRGDYDIMVFAWVTSPFPYGGAVQLWVTGQGNNFGNYSNPEVDRLINAAASNTDEAAANKLLNQADRILSQDAYALPLYQKPTFIALYDKVANVRDNSSLDGPPYNIEEWGLRK